MKNLAVIFTVVLLSVFHLTVNARTLDVTGDSNTDLGKFKITEQAPVNVKGEQVRAFELKYENSDKPVIILLDENKNCKNYIVRSKNLEIRYVCRKKTFGVNYVTGKFVQFDPEVNAFFLNEEEFNKQEILSTHQLSEEEALSIIASYFPHLIKDQKFLM